MSESKKELIEEHKRLTRILKEGTLKERLQEYELQMKELKHLLETGKYKPEEVNAKAEKNNEKLSKNKNGQWKLESTLNKTDQYVPPPPQKSYKGNHYIHYNGNWHRLINLFVDKTLSEKHGFMPKSNWYHLKDLLKGIIHESELAQEPHGGQFSYALSREEIPHLEKEMNIKKDKIYE